MLLLHAPQKRSTTRFGATCTLALQCSSLFSPAASDKLSSDTSLCPPPVRCDSQPLSHVVLRGEASSLSWHERRFFKKLTHLFLHRVHPPTAQATQHPPTRARDLRRQPSPSRTRREKIAIKTQVHGWDSMSNFGRPPPPPVKLSKFA